MVSRACGALVKVQNAGWVSEFWRNFPKVKKARHFLLKIKLSVTCGDHEESERDAGHGDYGNDDILRSETFMTFNEAVLLWETKHFLNTNETSLAWARKHKDKKKHLDTINNLNEFRR